MSDATTTPDYAVLFPAELWLFDPVSRTATPRSDTRRCSCGNHRFLWVARSGGKGASHVCVCEECYRNPRLRTLRRDGDTIYARLDVDTGEYTPIRNGRPINAEPALSRR